MALALAFFVPLLLAALCHGRPARDRWARLGLAVLLIGEWIGFYVVFWREGWFTRENVLPLALCDWAEAALIVALIAPHLKAYELGYFWGLAGTLQALVTPDLAYGFPDPRFIFFMLNHAGVIAALLYLTLGTGLRPLPQSIPRVVAATFIYVLVAGGADYALGANYGYLHDKGAHVSLLTWLAPWPWYIAELVPIGFLSIAVYYAPFLAIDLARRKP